MRCKYGYTYDLEEYFDSAVTDVSKGINHCHNNGILLKMDWVCEDDWKGPFSQSFFYLGGVAGTLILGFAGDQWGRFPSLYAANAILLVTGLAQPLCTTFVSYCFVRFLAGMSFDSSLQMLYLLCE